MHLRTLPLTELNPATYNPRVELQPGMPAYEKLKRSIEQFDLVQPIVWNEQTGHVVGGHQRLAILKDLGHQETTVVVVSLDEQQEKALNIALNNENVSGDWDVPKLTTLLDELNTIPDFDATLTGFSEKELHDLMFQPAAMPEIPEDDEAVSDQITITLLVPQQAWPQLRPQLDQLLQQHNFEIHIRENP